MINDVIYFLVALGVIILLVRIVFPIAYFTKLGQGIMPLLQSMVDYSSAFRHEKLLSEMEWQVQRALAAKSAKYPEWVYKRGFNPGLRSGFRYFLIHLECVAELYFSFNYWVMRPLEWTHYGDFRQNLVNVVHKNELLLQALIDFFSFNTLPQTDADFTSDMSALEASLDSHIPSSLELLDMSPDYIALTALTRNVRDTREQLLKLILALPVTTSVKH